jgi:hypothetical protein
MKKWYLSGFCLLALLTSSITYADSERTMTVSESPQEMNYFYVSIQDGGLLKGVYDGWCADWGAEIQADTNYDIKFYNSYSSLPEGLVDRPENLDEVNWLLNKNYVGRSSSSGHGTYTSGDVQLAIWSMLDNYFETTTVGPFSQARVDELVAKATQYGSNFVPRCDQVIGIILEPTVPSTGSRVQTTITEVPRNHFPKCAVPDSGLL